jgi:uncharacterized protein (UPF0212 family)
MAGITLAGQRYCPACQTNVQAVQKTQTGLLLVTEAPTGPKTCPHCGGRTQAVAPIMREVEAIGSLLMGLFVFAMMIALVVDLLTH